MNFLQTFFISFLYHCWYGLFFLFNMHHDIETAFADFFLENLTAQEFNKEELEFVEETLSDVIDMYTQVFFLLPTVRQRIYKEIFPIAQRKIRWLQMTRSD